MYMDQRAQLQLLGVALLHDLNHFPFMHYLQEYLPESIEDRWIVRQLIDAADDNSEDALAEFNLNVSTLCDIAYRRAVDQETPERQIISSLVNSAVDVDKLSYLILDSHHTGVRFGEGIELDTLIRLSSVDWVPTGNLHLVFEERAVSAIQVVLSARSGMFQSVYWHRINRAMLAMICRDFANILAEKPDHMEIVAAFLQDTLVGGEAAALQWIDAQHFACQGTNALSRRLMTDRRTIYRRVLTLKSEHPKESRLVTAIERALSGRRGVASRDAEVELLAPLRDYLGQLVNAPIDESMLLIDVPRRDLDAETREEALYFRRQREIVPYHDVMLQTPLTGSVALQRLRRHVRVFVHPSVWTQLQGEWSERVHLDIMNQLGAGSAIVAGTGIT
jgi:HD superfamily phosphohydrolase